MIDEHLKKQGHTWKSYCDLIGKDRKNFKRTLTGTVDRLNIWLKPLGLKIQIVSEQK